MKITKWNGRPISKPGWYSGMPLEKYHSAGICAGPAVSSTNLRTCWRQSPAHMFAGWCENPQAVQRTSGRYLVVGAAAHHLLLGEDGIRTKFVAFPETYRDKVTGKEKPWHNGADFCHDWKNKQQQSGRTPVTVAELQSIMAMARSLALDPLVKDDLLQGAIECSGFVVDKETGLWLKVRPDVIPASSSDFVDLKTASDVTSPALQYAIRSYGYQQQGALIWEVCEQFGMAFASFLLMFIETVAPYCARAVLLEGDDLARGRLQNRAMLRTIAECQQRGHWPGPGEGDVRPLPLAHDERNRIDERLKHGGRA